MASDDLGLAHPSAQAAEGDVRAALEQVLAYLEGKNTKTKSNGVFNAHARRTICGLLALSAEAAGTIAAAQKQAAEEMRERAAEDERDRLFDIAMTPRGEFRHPVAQMQREAIRGFLRDQGAMRPGERVRLRSLFSSPEDQQKAAATPTIADPDGESGR